MIRVVIAEDQAMVLGALAALLETEHDIEVVVQARDGREALDAVTRHAPDVLLADIEMPEMTGLEVAAAVAQKRLPTRVIILTTFARAGYLRRALEAGAAGYLLKDSPAGELTGADIAAKLFLSEGTVRNYLSAAIAKLGARNRVEAARTARAKGWL